MDYSILKKIAQKRGITLKSLSESIGVTEAGFHGWIRKNTFPVDKLEAIAEMLNVDIVELFGAETVSRKDIEYKDRYLSCMEEKEKLYQEIIAMSVKSRSAESPDSAKLAEKLKKGN